MADRSKRYKKIDFLGEGQVRYCDLEDKHLKGALSCYHSFFRLQFATVYKAEDQETGKIVAVKKVNKLQLTSISRRKNKSPNFILPSMLIFKPSFNFSMNLFNIFKHSILLPC